MSLGGFHLPIFSFVYSSTPYTLFVVLLLGATKVLDREKMKINRKEIAGKDTVIMW